MDKNANRNGDCQYWEPSLMERFKQWFKRDKPTEGFTLIELLVTLAIIAILSTLAVQALDKARKTLNNSNNKATTTVFVAQ